MNTFPVTTEGRQAFFRGMFQNNGGTSFGVAEGQEIQSRDGSTIQVTRISIGAAVGTLSYVRANDPTGRVIHVNCMKH